MKRKEASETDMKISFFIAVAACCLLAAGLGAATDPTVIKFRIGAFSTDRGMPSYKNIGLERTGPVEADEEAYYLVQFTGPMQDTWRREIVALGGRIMDDYIPNNAWVVKLKGQAITKLEKLPQVRFMGYFQPAFRISPDLLAPPSRYSEDRDGRIILQVAVFKGEDASAVEKRLASRLGVKIEQTGGGIVKVSVQEDLAVEIAKEAAHYPEVYWVERYYQPVLHNAWSRWINQSRDTTGMGSSGTTWKSKLRIKSADDSLKMPMYSRGLYGQGQIVGDDDTGLDWDNIYFIHTGLSPQYDKNKDTIYDISYNGHRKIVGYNVLADTFDLNSSGHGTHTCGSIAADSLNSTHNGSLSDTVLARAMGMAPMAKLAFTDIGDATDALILPNDYSDIYIWAYNAGARITSSSWGQGNGGTSGYTISTQQIDRCAWNHKDLIMFRSAGNSNNGSPADSCNSPATAKNIVCLGANESGFGSDATSWSATGTTTRNEILDVAEFSSHGPTKEGLRRPNILASGGWYIWSTDSDGSLTPASPDYGITYMGGTSMSTPTAAGLCALVRQYLTEGWYPSGTKTPADAIAAPSGSLLKAMMIASTRNSPGAYSTDALGSTATKNVPSQGQGWGAVVLDDALYFLGDARKTKLYDETYGFTAAGQTHTYTITTGASTTQDFKVVLVYYDYPSAMPVTDISVNNLNLTVTSGATTYLGNVFGTDGYSATGGSADTTNPEEVVWLAGSSANSRTWTITVTAAAVNVGPQPYALVICGDLSNAVPGRPSQLKLFDYARVPTKTPALSFSAIDPEANPVDFRITYDTLSSFATAASQVTSTVASGAVANYTFGTALKNQRTYYWKVQARDPDGTNSYGAYGDVRSFTIDTLMTPNSCSWLIKTNFQFNNNQQLNGLKVSGDSVTINTLSKDVVFYQDFESSDGGFTMVSNNASNLDNWKWTDSSIAYQQGSPSGTKWWRVNTNAYNGVNNEHLISPIFSCVSAIGCSLTWFGAHRFYNANCSLNVDYSINGGSSWTKLTGWSGTANYLSPGQQYPSFRVAAFDGQSNCRLRWRFYDTYGYGGGVDNVLVFTTGQNNLAGQLRTSPIAYAELNNTYARSNWGYIHCWKQNAADSIGLQVEYCNNNVWALVPDGALAGNSVGYFDNTRSTITRNLTGLNTTTYDSIRVVVKMFKTPGKATLTPVLRALEVGSISATPLAVELVEFSCLLTEAGVVTIYWRTACELDNYRWEIERSADNESYVKIGELPAAGNSPTGAYYSFTDPKPLNGVNYYRLVDISLVGERTYHGPISVTVGRPTAYALSQNYPNPFSRGATTIKYALKDPGHTVLKVYNVAGQEVRTLVDGEQQPNFYAVSWDGRNGWGREVANGVYFYRLKSGGFTDTRKMTVLR